MMKRMTILWEMNPIISLMGFSYHQARIAKKDKNKTNFVIECNSFLYNVMFSRLNNALVVFSIIEIKAFKEYIHEFM
jgi:hypothetical protein